MDVVSLAEINDLGVDDLQEQLEDMESFDDLSNEPLQVELVMKARAEEPQYLQEMEGYEYATLDECRRATGKIPICARWIDMNKEDSLRRNYRTRLVGQEFLVDIRPEFLAATPPTECFQMLQSRAAENENLNVLYIDVGPA